MAMSVTSDIAAAFAQLVRSWWNADRIRVSPYAGRLLNLSVMERVQIRNEIYRVESRQYQETSGGRYLSYRLFNFDTQMATLTVPLRATGRSEGTLTVDGGQFRVFEDDVVLITCDGSPNTCGD